MAKKKAPAKAEPKTLTALVNIPSSMARPGDLHGARVAKGKTFQSPGGDAEKALLASKYAE